MTTNKPQPSKINDHYQVIIAVYILTPPPQNNDLSSGDPFPILAY